MKIDGYPVDAIAPEAAVFLSIKLDIINLKEKKGKILSDARQITDFILREAKIALIPFFAFGASKNNTWYRISVGTCKTVDLEKIISALKNALDLLINENAIVEIPIYPIGLKDKPVVHSL